MIDLDVFQQRVLAIITLLVFIILGIDKGSLDLGISESIVNKNSGIGIFTAGYGEIPGWGVVIIATIAFLLLKNEQSTRYVVANVVILIAAIAASYYRLGFFVIPLVLSMALIAYYLVYRSTLSRDAIINFSKITLMMLLFLPGVLTQVIKSSFGRTRYRDLLADHSDFTPWYQINGFTGERSFPSGHAAMGIMVFPLMMLINSTSFSKTHKYILGTILLLWSLFVGYGRVVIGAHYTTDVLFSIIAGIIGYNIIRKNNEKLKY